MLSLKEIIKIKLGNGQGLIHYAWHPCKQKRRLRYRQVPREDHVNIEDEYRSEDRCQEEKPLEGTILLTS